MLSMPSEADREGLEPITRQPMDTKAIKISKLKEVTQSLRNEGLCVTENVSLSRLTYLRTGGVAALIIMPKTLSQLACAVSLLARFDIPYKVVGNTSNLLFQDDAEYTCVLFTIKLDSITTCATTRSIVAECGVMMPELSRFALLLGAKGFEGLEGIPGTIGGGIYMNAGAYGSEIRDYLTEIECLTSDGENFTMRLEDAALTHRSSRFRAKAEGLIITRVRFSYEIGDVYECAALMELFHSKRHKYQEFILPNLGSLYSGSPYRVLAADHFTFRLIAAIFYFFNYKFKIFRRESPTNRAWLNKHAEYYLAYGSDTQNYSDKTLNCLVNRGQGTAEMLRFITHMERTMKGRVPLENEIVKSF